MFEIFLMFLIVNHGGVFPAEYIVTFPQVFETYEDCISFGSDIENNPVLKEWSIVVYSEITTMYPGSMPQTAGCRLIE